MYAFDMITPLLSIYYAVTCEHIFKVDFFSKHRAVNPETKYVIPALAKPVAGIR